jgi:hypothetical protein
MKSLTIGIIGILCVVLGTLSIIGDFKADKIREQNSKKADSCLMEKKKLVIISQRDFDSLKCWSISLDACEYSDKEFKKYKAFSNRVLKRSEMIENESKKLDLIFNKANK